jgi:hypothetical protein
MAAHRMLSFSMRGPCIPPPNGVPLWRGTYSPSNSPSVKVISQMAVGYDNIDIPAATARKIPVGHTPGILTDATADLTWALLMAAVRRVVEADRFARGGQWRTWEPNLFLGPNITGATFSRPKRFLEGLPLGHSGGLYTIRQNARIICVLSNRVVDEFSC